MNSGDRDECVRVYKKDCTGTNDFGDPIETEETVVPIYHVKVVSRSVRSKLSGDADTHRERHVLIGLLEREILEEMFVEWEGRKYTVENVIHMRSRDETHTTIESARDRAD